MVNRFTGEGNDPGGTDYSGGYTGRQAPLAPRFAQPTHAPERMTDTTGSAGTAKGYAGSATESDARYPNPIYTRPPYSRSVPVSRRRTARPEAHGAHSPLRATMNTRDDIAMLETQKYVIPGKRHEDDITMLETQKYVTPTNRQISYQPTPWSLVNSLLGWVDELTGGKAGVLQRLFTYLLIGGTAALVNLGVLATFFHFGSAKNLPYNLLANAVAYEVSIMANFIPNDYITFRHLEGHSRSWAARCLRFHITSIGGIIVTFTIYSILFGLVGLPALIAQAIALIIAVFFNFTFHHVFTYRGRNH